MPSLNKVILIGHLTKDPELKTTQSGTSVCSFSIGVNRPKGKNDEHPVSDFFTIVAWDKKADFVSKYFHKGDAICVCGSLRNRSWEDQNGNKRTVTEVNADEVSFIGGKKEAAPAAENPVDIKSDAPSFEDVTNDDLPF